MSVYTFSRVWLKPLLVLPLLMLAACGSEEQPSATPTNFMVTAGDGRATVSWDNKSNATFRVFKARASQITPANYATFPEQDKYENVRPPYVISGLTNGQTYAFTIDAASPGGAPGDAAASVAIVPRPAGDSWNSGVAAGTRDLNAVVSANGRVVAAGDGGVLFETTTGETWTPIGSGTLANLRGLLYDNARLVAVGDGGAALISTELASGALVWTATTPIVNSRLNSVAYNGTTYVAVGSNGVLLSGVAGTDRNGAKTITWTPQNSTVSVSLNKVAFLNNKFVVVANGGFILTSPDGITWTVLTSSGTTASLNDIGMISVSGVPTYFIVGDSGTLLRSTDLANWTADTLGIGLNLNTITVGNSRVMIGGANGTVLYSTGNSAWTILQAGRTNNSIQALAFSGGGRYIGVGPNGSNIYSY